MTEVTYKAENVTRIQSVSHSRPCCSKWSPPSQSSTPGNINFTVLMQMREVYLPLTKLTHRFGYTIWSCRIFLGWLCLLYDDGERQFGILWHNQIHWMRKYSIGRGRVFRWTRPIYQFGHRIVEGRNPNFFWKGKFVPWHQIPDI